MWSFYICHKTNIFHYNLSQVLFDGLKYHYYAGEDITFKYLVKNAEGPLFVEGFLALYPADYKSAKDYIVNVKTDMHDGGIVKFPC